MARGASSRVFTASSRTTARSAASSVTTKTESGCRSSTASATKAWSRLFSMAASFARFAMSVLPRRTFSALASIVLSPAFPALHLPSLVRWSRLIPYCAIYSRASSSGGRQELVLHAVRLLALRSLPEDVDPADLPRVLEVGPAARAVVRVPDLDDPQAADRLRDQVHQGAVLDLVLHDDAVLLEDPHVRLGGDHRVALVLDPPQVLRREVRGLEVDPAPRRVDLVPDRAGPVDPEHEPGHQVLGRVHPHVRVPAVPVEHAVDGVRGRHAVDDVLELALLL